MILSLICMRVYAPILCAAGIAHALYVIEDNYNATNFFSEFDFFADRDPTEGFVHYSTASTANMSSLAGYTNNGIFLGVDHTTINPPGGRGSVRVSSKKAYTHGLFIADIAHMPDSTCGVWPAFWTVGSSWPANGEIDIIEGVNKDTTTAITLHTSPGCSLDSAGSLPSSNLTTSNCNAGDAGLGCSLATTNEQGYGTGFNAIGGGVYAMQWTNSAIKVFFFPRNSIPEDITASNPDPDNWGTPVGSFSGSECTIDSHFKSHNIVFDTTFCGVWAGKVWDTDGSCASLAETCDDYVAMNPKAFATAYWTINYVKVYQATTASKRNRLQAMPFTG